MTNLAMKPDKKDLIYLKELIEAGKVTPVIDKTYPLGDLAEALNQYGKGRTRGKLIITIY